MADKDASRVADEKARDRWAERFSPEAQDAEWLRERSSTEQNEARAREAKRGDSDDQPPQKGEPRRTDGVEPTTGPQPTGDRMSSSVVQDDVDDECEGNAGNSHEVPLSGDSDVCIRCGAQVRRS